MLWWLCGVVAGGAVYWIAERIGRWWVPPAGVEACHGERADGRLVTAVYAARREIDLHAESVPGMLADALADACRRGLAVRVVVPGDIPEDDPSLLLLRQAGVEVRTADGVPAISAAIDGHAAFAGSPGELLAVSGTPEAAGPHTLRLRARFAAAGTESRNKSELRGSMWQEVTRTPPPGRAA